MTPRVKTATVFQGIPTCFRASCWQAAQGGAGGYDGAGWVLLHNLSSYVEGDTDEEQDAKLGELADLLKDRDDDAVLAWLRREFPRCMQLVPSRRIANFLRGVFESWEHEGCSF